VPSVFLQPWGPLLVVIHALSSIVLCGASVHQALLAVQLVRRQPVRPSLLQTYALTTLGAYLSVMISGALLYPRYRVVIRALFLDRQAPWAANLFDFKENLATLGLPLAIGALLMARPLSAAPPSIARTATNQAPEPAATRVVVAMYCFLTVGTALICLSNVIAGLLCTAVRGA
jgi:hypothetical protein